MLVFEIIVYLLGLTAIVTGINDFWKGAAVKGDFGEIGEATNDPTLNFTIRFFGAIWTGFGALLILFATDVKTYGLALIVAFIFVILGGIGRVWSMKQFGIAEGRKTTNYSIVTVELVLTPVLLVWFLVG